MLEKKSKIEIDRASEQVTKIVTSQSGMAVERIALEVLRSLQVKSSPTVPFLVPGIEDVNSSERSLSISYIDGIRLNDIVGILNKIIEHHPSTNMVERALELKSFLVSRCLENIAWFQHPSIQRSLKNALSQYLMQYDYNNKLLEALNYIHTFFNNDYPISSLLVDEINLVCHQLVPLSVTCFRDSVLKNQILEGVKFSNLKSLDILIQSSPNDISQEMSNQHFSDFFDAILNADFNLLQIYNYDFEQAAELVASVDDWNQILTAEVVGLPYEVGSELAQKRLNIAQDIYHYSVVFRSLRAWARRLFYRSEKPVEWLKRYGYETIGHHYFLTLQAIECLRKNSSHSDLLGNLYRMLRAYKPTSIPWPWHVHPLKHWMV